MFLTIHQLRTRVHELRTERDQLERQIFEGEIALGQAYAKVELHELQLREAQAQYAALKEMKERLEIATLTYAGLHDRLLQEELKEKRKREVEAQEHRAREAERRELAQLAYHVANDGKDALDEGETERMGELKEKYGDPLTHDGVMLVTWRKYLDDAA
jgi:hypothetical protein